MEDRKWLYFVEFINQKDDIWRVGIREIRKLEADLRACYFQSVGLEGDPFVNMMLFDSCFIIQLFIKWHLKKLDAACDAGCSMPELMGDLLMLDNQIPFSVLDTMFNLYTFGRVHPPDEDRRHSFITLAANTLHYQEERAIVPKPDVKIKHLLHLFYLLFVPAPEYSPPIQMNSKKEGQEPHRNYLQLLQKCDPRGFFKSKKLNEKNRSPRVIPSAIELKEYGVTLKKKEKCKSFLDVSFKDGILEVPQFMIEECGRSTYLNLIAFEQYSSDGDGGVGRVDKPLSSFAVFMACLINMAVDVLLLERVGILENNLANSVEGARFFGQQREYVHDNHYLRLMFVQVIDHCQAFWPKHRAALRHGYFSSPWTIFSLMGAMLVLGITIFRTICLVLITFLKKKI
ncbi:UPF0481 protein At3g47200-like [Carex rostrata]